MNLPTRFLPHTLLGIALFSGLPLGSYSAEATAVPVESEEDTTEEEAPKEASPAIAKFWSAIRLLASSRPEEVAQGRADMQAASDLEFSHAQFELGRYHLSGAYGFKKDLRKGANLFVLAAERGNAYAMAAAGQCFYSGTGFRKNEEKAIRWLQAAIADDADYSRPQPPPDYAAAQAPQPSGANVAGALFIDYALSARANAQHLLGLIEQRRKNLEAAHGHFVAAATVGVDGRDGNFAAAIQAALDYAFGLGTARDPEKAKEMLAHSRTLSKRMGIAQIQSWVQSKRLDEFATADLEEEVSNAGDTLFDTMQFQIARQMSDKKSKDYNPREAAIWYEVAAESGQVWPMMNLALLLGGSELGAPDPAAAFKWWEKAGGGEKPKHTLAAANLAICYQNGIGVGKDTARAAEIFARQRQNNFLCHLGSTGGAPTTVQTYEQEMALLETAAKKADAHAQYLMGIRYRDGWDVPSNGDKASSWFKKSAKSSHPGAIRELGRIAESIPWGMRVAEHKALKLALERYKQASDLGDAEAAVNLAYMHQKGQGTAASPELAERYYLRGIALDPEIARAHNNLATIYENRLRAVIDRVGGDVETLRTSMLASYEEAARLGLPLASSNLGLLYLSGQLVPQDLEKAYFHYDQAAADGAADAHYQLGLMHENGLGVPVTLAEAAYHYRLAALEGHWLALERLIDSYFSGRGVDVDWDMATFWLLRSVERGNIASIVTLADIQLRRGDAKEAVKLFKLLAEGRSTLLEGFACERLSICYAEGLGVKANPQRAKRYFDRAVELENGDALAHVARGHFANNRATEGVEVMTRAARSSSNAKFYLGQMLLFGTHVEKDEAKAMQLMRDAAKLNHPDAMYFLAASTYNRVSGSPDIDEAIRLAESAEKMGVTKAAALREKLERRRDKAQDEQEQIARARAG